MISEVLASVVSGAELLYPFRVPEAQPVDCVDHSPARVQSTALPVSVIPSLRTHKMPTADDFVGSSFWHPPLCALRADARVGMRESFRIKNRL